jgi:serine protease
MDPNYSTPQTGHGTHVGGIIVGRSCGITNHNIFDYPVCRGTSEKCYSSYIEDAFSAILSRLSSTKRRGVINMSFGAITSTSSSYIDLYNYYLKKLIDAGAVPVAAAGNENQNACSFYPAASSYALGIGSHDSNYYVSSFSNYGACVDIYAPGDSIISAWNTGDNNYATASGTSMAAPMISGIAADLLWRYNTLTYDQIKSILQQSSNNINLLSCPNATYPCKALKINCNANYFSATPAPTTATITSKPTATATTTASPTTTTTTKSSCRSSGSSCVLNSQCCSSNCRRLICD